MKLNLLVRIQDVPTYESCKEHILVDSDTGVEYFMINGRLLPRMQGNGKPLSINITDDMRRKIKSRIDQKKGRII